MRTLAVYAGTLPLLASCAPAEPVASSRSGQTVGEGEIFAEVHGARAPLTQVIVDAQSRGWRIDCATLSRAEPFVRVQLPATATYKDIEYFVNIGPSVTQVQMLYTGMRKEVCPGRA